MAVATAADMAHVRTLEQRLEDEVSKMISAGHLRPAYYSFHEKFYFQMRQTYQTVLLTGHEYWSNPAETIYTLLRARPYLSAAVQSQLDTYVQSEWTTYPPYTYTHAGWGGAAREHFARQTDSISESYYGVTDHSNPGEYDDDQSYPGFNFNPFNIYACYKYAQQYGGASTIIEQVRNLVQQAPSPFVDSRPFLLNMYLAGYVGFLGLQDLNSEAQDATVLSWQSSALSLRVAAESVSLINQPGIEFGGYLYLVPEVADQLRPSISGATSSRMATYQTTSAPYWFAAKIDELNRFMTNSDDVLDEGATSLYYAYWSPFNAKAMILEESRSQLEPYVDVPGVWRGDLYHINNLVSAIEAPSGAPAVVFRGRHAGSRLAGGRLQ